MVEVLFVLCLYSRIPVHHNQKIKSITGMVYAGGAACCTADTRYAPKEPF